MNDNKANLESTTLGEVISGSVSLGIEIKLLGNTKNEKIEFAKNILKYI